jgi:hypothetical protein
MITAMTKTVNVRLDSILVVVRVIENAIAADRRPIEKSKYVESGEPFAKISSSESETS